MSFRIFRPHHPEYRLINFTDLMTYIPYFFRDLPEVLPFGGRLGLPVGPFGGRLGLPVGPFGGRLGLPVGPFGGPLGLPVFCDRTAANWSDFPTVEFIGLYSPINSAGTANTTDASNSSSIGSPNSRKTLDMAAMDSSRKRLFI
jgi:hypothetical protein